MNKKKNLEEYSAGVNLYLKKRNVEILRNYLKLKKKKSSGNPLIIIKMGKIKNCWMKIIKKY